MTMIQGRELRWRLAFVPHPWLMADPGLVSCDLNSHESVLAALRLMGYDLPGDVAVFKCETDPIVGRYNVILESGTFEDLWIGLPKWEDGSVNLFMVPSNWLPEMPRPEQVSGVKHQREEGRG